MIGSASGESIFISITLASVAGEPPTVEVGTEPVWHGIEVLRMGVALTPTDDVSELMIRLPSPIKHDLPNGEIKVHRREPDAPSKIVVHQWDPDEPSRAVVHRWDPGESSKIVIDRWQPGTYSDIVVDRRKPGSVPGIRVHRWEPGARSRIVVHR